MGVSALRVAACAGVVVGALMLGYGTAAVAFAEPDGTSPGVSDEQDSKVGATETVGQNSLNGAGAGEEQQNSGGGTEPGTAFIERAGDSVGTTGGTDGAEGTNTSVGSDHVDNTVVRVDPERQEKPSASTYHFPYYLLQIRRDGGKWWNANRIIARFQDVVPLLAAPSPPEPEPVPGPAFRGGAPEPEPVLDASGGVVGGGGSDYQASGSGGAPVLSAPIVVMPVPPPAAARFPAFPPTAPTAPGIGSAVARGPQPAATAQGGRAAAPQEQTLPAENAVRAMTGQGPKPGYTDYLRGPSLTNLAGAALPGIAGILLMTLGGGVIGYRQAEAGRMIRTSVAARYLP
ncbi:hypothetical protein A5662_20950 [Mycobacteriaceae bacterium 1482268.1]|nr:hypothetical protein A5662_20950 [Mycobacteriaceae bacterium 1482268.1]